MSNNINPNFPRTSFRSQKRSRTEQTEQTEPINNLTGHYFQTSSTSHDNDENHRKPYVSETQNSKRHRPSDDVLINKMVEAGRIDDALDILNRMQASPCKKKRAYNTILDALGKAGRIDESAELFNQMWQSGIAPDKRTYDVLIYGMAKGGNIDKAFNFFNKMIEYGIKPDEIALRVYSVLINGLVKVGRIEDALVILNKMHEYSIEPNLIVYNILISHFVVNDDFPRAIYYLDQAKNNNIFLHDLGYNSEEKTLNLHTTAIYYNEQIGRLNNFNRSHLPGVSLELGKVIFMKLINQNIPITGVIVGKNGDGILHDGMLSFIRQLEFNVETDPINAGMLLIRY